MDMVGYKLMQKYGLLSLSHDVTKRIVVQNWVWKQSEETLWLCFRNAFTVCVSTALQLCSYHANN